VRAACNSRPETRPIDTEFVTRRSIGLIVRRTDPATSRAHREVLVGRSHAACLVAGDVEAPRQGRRLLGNARQT